MNVNFWRSRKPHATRVARGITLVVDETGRRYFRARASRKNFKIDTDFTSTGSYDSDLERVRVAEQCLRLGEAFPWAVSQTSSQSAERSLEELACGFTDQSGKWHSGIIEQQTESHTNDKSRQQWPNTLEKYAWPVLRGLTLDEINVRHALEIFQTDNFWTEHPATAGRVRQRLQKIFGIAVAQRLAHDLDAPRPANPFAFEGTLEAFLTRSSTLEGRKKRPQLAMDWRQVPEFYRRWSETVTGRRRDALRLIMLTALRGGNVAKLRTEWIDGNDIHFPAAQMKAKKPFILPVPTQAMKIIEAQTPVGGFVFGSKKGNPLSTDAFSRRMSELTREWVYRPVDADSDHCVPHGFRTSFRTWALETSAADSDLVELSIAHTVPGVRGAYTRGPVLEARRVLMQRWADYVTSETNDGS